MRREDNGRSAPYWRAVLEARWRVRLQAVTELSMAYHGAASGDAEDRQARRLLRRAVAARQRLADTEEALGRVAAGIFGRCEQCDAPIPGGLLAAAPESRYCARCARATAEPVTTGPVTTGPRPVGAQRGRAAAAHGSGRLTPRAARPGGGHR
jgi:RNA polymerase-binding transcription factor DksA